MTSEPNGKTEGVNNGDNKVKLQKRTNGTGQLLEESMISNGPILVQWGRLQVSGYSMRIVPRFMNLVSKFNTGFHYDLE